MKTVDEFDSIEVDTDQLIVTRLNHVMALMSKASTSSELKEAKPMKVGGPEPLLTNS